MQACRKDTNVGTWSLLAKSLVPAARIHAFEPLPEHQTRFFKTIAGVEGVTLHPIAIGSHNTDATLHVTEFSDSSSILPPAEAGWSHFGTREVAQLPLHIVRLDDYRRAKQLPMPDLIKLDIQGYELEALKGAPECLASVKAVIVEVSFIEYYEGQCLFHDVASYLANLGLLIRAFGFNILAGRTVGQTDVLFMPTTPASGKR